MAQYTINTAGSATMTLPAKIAKNDTLLFNVTNTTVSSKYDGTMLTYTFPFDCTVTLEAAGGRGGKGNRCTDAQVGKGALLKGNFTFLKGDTLLICVGQAGSDHGGNVSDGTTGAGGGGTFIVKKSTDNTGDTYSGSGVGNGWKVKPLIISAGGNGGRDIGYSGSGTIYHGLATTEATRSLSSCSGASYSARHSNTNAGTHFLAGARGATYSYSRNGISYAGFGGGGGAADDNWGGGGGGYYGGTQTMSACSFIDSTATSVVRTNGANFGEGYFKITFINIKYDINARCNINGSVKKVSEMKVNVNGAWKNVKKVMVKVNGVWK